MQFPSRLSPGLLALGFLFSGYARARVIDGTCCRTDCDEWNHHIRQRHTRHDIGYQAGDRARYSGDSARNRLPADEESCSALSVGTTSM